MNTIDAARIARILDAWELSATRVRDVEQGLVNATYEVDTDRGRFVLQRLNALFDPALHENIAAVTVHLKRRGVATPELVPTADGALWAMIPPGECWRLTTFMPGRALDRLQNAAQAREIGAWVARFHTALDDLDHTFVALRPGAHDTAAHLARLEDAVARHGDHRLAAPVTKIAGEIAAAVEALPAFPDVPVRVIHGDLKVSNALFDDDDRVTCLIDLDTLAPGALHVELGDAWRSWCNPAGEDTEEAHLELDRFRASLEGYAANHRLAITAAERDALAFAPDWISVELSARFAADALVESYFGWDPSRFEGRGEHNLVRARGQLALHRRFVATRTERARELLHL